MEQPFVCHTYPYYQTINCSYCFVNSVSNRRTTSSGPTENEICVHKTDSSPKFDRLFVDVNFLLAYPNDPIIKELAIVGRALDGTTHLQQCLLLQSPCHFNTSKRKPPVFTDIHVREKYGKMIEQHGIDWMDGEVPLLAVRKFIRQLVALSSPPPVFITGSNKVKYFKTLFNLRSAQVCSEESVMPSTWDNILTPQPLLCAFHTLKPGKQCALNNAYLMNLRYEEYIHYKTNTTNSRSSSGRHSLLIPLSD